jgi:hypothetical protein
MPWQVPGYRQREDLAGGTGRVVFAVEESTGQVVVIKYLSTDSSYTSDGLRLAIDDISGLPDDYFVRIRELVQESGHNAIVMDRLTGTTMRALIRDDGPFAPESALVVFRDILTGLTYAHALDIVHGDVSPENVMVSPDGRPILLNAGAATWDPREPTLSSGVYLAPERWDGGPPTAAADVYAATVAFVESLAGEPPYWEDTDLDRLRNRHVSEDVDVSHIPAALHDVVRAGLAKDADERLTSAALLDLVETAAIAGYGRDWADRGRDGVVQRVRSGSLPSGDRSAVAPEDSVRDTEDVANDDYYTNTPVDDSSSTNPAGDADAEAVMAAAAEIVAFAQLRDAAEADAILAASTDEELTEEEENAVAEIERLLFLDDQLPDVPLPPAEMTDASPSPEPAGGQASDAEPATPAAAAEALAADEVIAASEIPAAAEPTEHAAAEQTEHAAAEPPDHAPADNEPIATPSGSDHVPAQPDPGAPREPVASETDRPAADADSRRVPAQTASAEALAAESAAGHFAGTSATAAEPAASGAGAGHGEAAGPGAAAGDAAPPPDPASEDDAAPPVGAPRVPVGASSGSDGGRRPWWLALSAVAAVLVVAGLLVWAGVGGSGPSAHPAAGSSGRPIATTSPPAASASGATGSPNAGSPSATGSPSAGSPGGTGSSSSASAGASGASGAASTGEPSSGPTLPLTGFEHPIRLMAAVAAGFVFVGGFLLYAGRRRDEAGA